MVLQLTGQLRIPASAPAERFVSAVLSRIAYELEDENVGHIRESSGTVSYRRGYNLLPGARSRLVSFDPGEFTVSAEGSTVLIRYHLGLGPLYFPVAVTPICLLLLWYYSHNTKLFVTLLAIVLGGTVGGTIFAIWRLRIWLKSVASSAINKVASSGSEEA